MSDETRVLAECRCCGAFHPRTPADPEPRAGSLFVRNWCAGCTAAGCNAEKGIGTCMSPLGEAHGMCGCGRVLYAVMRDGQRVGVTHSMADDAHHLAYWRAAAPGDL